MHRVFRFIAPATLLLGAAASLHAQTIKISTVPGNATIYTYNDGGVRTVLGTGTAKYKVHKESINRVWAAAEGFDSIFYDVGKKDEKSGVVMELNTRLVKVTAEPYDAGIYVDGDLKGTRVFTVKVPKGTPVTVEVWKDGFKPVGRTYRFDAGADLPPVTERFELSDRMVHVGSSPEGANFKVDGNVIATGKEAKVIVPAGECVTVVAEKEGFAPKDMRYCYRGAQIPPTEDVIHFTDRLVSLATNPGNANIIVGGRTVAQGIYNLLVPARTCALVVAKAPSYASQKREICAADDPPSSMTFDLPFDEAYTSSVQSDQANVNFTIEVGPGKTPDQAWRTISQVVLGKFDVLEITDKETGYMRTAWEVTKFEHSMVRTRFIVKLGNSTPLKYVVKLDSQYSNEPGVTVKDDQKFDDWDRLLNTYKDLINEMQARLR